MRVNIDEQIFILESIFKHYTILVIFILLYSHINIFFNNFDPSFWNRVIIINVEHPVHFSDVISSDKKIDKVHSGVLFALEIFFQSSSESLWKFFRRFTVAIDDVPESVDFFVSIFILIFYVLLMKGDSILGLISYSRGPFF